MFIRSLDEKELEKEALESMMGSSVDDKIFPQSDVGQSMRWSKFKNIVILLNQLYGGDALVKLYAGSVFPVLEIIKAWSKLMPITPNSQHLNVSLRNTEMIIWQFRQTQKNTFSVLRRKRMTILATHALVILARPRWGNLSSCECLSRMKSSCKGPKRTMR